MKRENIVVSRERLVSGNTKVFVTACIEISAILPIETMASEKDSEDYINLMKDRVWKICHSDEDN